MELKVSETAVKKLKKLMALGAAIYGAALFICLVVILNFGKYFAVLLPFSVAFGLLFIGIFPLIIVFSRISELIDSQAVFVSEKCLLFYSRRANSRETEGFESHFYWRLDKAEKVRNGKIFLSVKGIFRYKEEGYAVLDSQNPDDESTGLDFDEQAGLIFDEGSYIKRKSVRLLRIFTANDEKALMELVSKKK